MTEPYAIGVVRFGSLVVVETLDVDCPYCEVRAGEPCMVESAGRGTPRPPHVARLRAAKAKKESG